MIYTLYSFKGGVGRSMALANLAECFYSRQLRVVMIDWDLEAPGLESYFFSANPDGSTVRLEDVRAKRGLMDMFLEYKKSFPELSRLRSLPNAVESPATKEIEDRTREATEFARNFLKGLKDVPEHLKRIDVADRPTTERFSGSLSEFVERRLTPIEDYLIPIHQSGKAGLWLLSAGARSESSFSDYANAVQDFDWLEFLAAYDGKAYLDWLRSKLNKFAHVVLIDSRTGVTEMGGICTRHMADAVVAFCAPNFQNIDGVVRIVDAFDSEAAKSARDNRGFQVVVVPTRIDTSESGLLDEFSSQFKTRIESGKLIPDAFEKIDRPLWNLQVPYIPKYNYRERRVIGPDTGTPDEVSRKLVAAYQKIAVHLAVLGSDEIRSKFQSEIAETFPNLQPPRKPRVTLALPGYWVDRPSESQDLKQTLLAAARKGRGRLALWGQAGMGKTTLAIRVCQDEEIQAAFPDGVVWFTLDRAPGIDQIREFLRKTFTLPANISADALRHALEQRRFLFVVDDVWSTEELDAVFRFGTDDTRLILTRDLSVASAFGDNVVSVGLFSSNTRSLLPNQFLSDVGSDRPLSLLAAWPLGASLLYGELERRKARREPLKQSEDAILAAYQKSGVVAFDVTGSTDKSMSVALTLDSTLNRLAAFERRLLIDIASGRRDQSGNNAGLKRLIDLGLVVESSENVQADEIVRAYLKSQGALEPDADVRRRLHRKQTIREGYTILQGTATTLERTRSLAEQAKDMRSFSLARRLFALARKHREAATLATAEKLKLVQRQALCTYKDDDLVAEARFGRAFELLVKDGDLGGTSPSQETLGLAGAIYKGRWRLGGQRRDLEESLKYYRRGLAQNLDSANTDYGYTRINAAFILDLLAAQDANESPEIANERRESARAIRLEIIERLPGIVAQTSHAWAKNSWWYGATMAEACFGVDRHEEARFWLREALSRTPPDWQLETLARQLAALADARSMSLVEESPAWQTLAVLIGDAVPALRSLRIGKLGLALSGGGFRASLFHIGVLARLAEMDVLRHVEVLSCVSGGSIVGAHYYLEVRRLLHQKVDRDITREDYIQVVRNIETDFLAGVQKNLRTRLFASWIANILSIFKPGYTRTEYLGELLERHIYCKVGNEGVRPIWLNDLAVEPRDDGDEFNPKLDNWRRRAKVPILLLNATTLNTGHNWQFAVRWMGEPPIGSGSGVDSNDILRRLYYDEAPPRHRRVRLGHAVAASACVPALFDPIEFRELYPKRVVRLVDGGVHDNQGMVGLMEQECTAIVVSDASGQMNSQRRPSGEAVFATLRSNSILMARVREQEFRELQALRNVSALSGLLFLHLKKDLDTNHVDWIGCRDPYGTFDESLKQRALLTSYNFPKSVQTLLAGIRTDLDSFSDLEAYTLMLSGYRMAGSEFSDSISGLSVSTEAQESWRFRAIEPVVDHAVDREIEHEHLLKRLRIGSTQAAKPWRVKPTASVIISLGLVGALVAVIWQVRQLSLDMNAIFSAARWPLIGLLSAVVLALLAGIVTRRKSFTTIFSGLVAVTVGWILAWIYLLSFDSIFKLDGTLRSNDPHERQDH